MALLWRDWVEPPGHLSLDARAIPHCFTPLKEVNVPLSAVT